MLLSFPSEAVPLRITHNSLFKSRKETDLMKKKNHLKTHPTGKLRFTLTNDYLFHIVFQRNKKILRGLIRSLLNLKDEEILDIILENPITSGQRVNDKTIILDLFITLNNNKRINIEMQVLNAKDWPERSLTYLCKSFDNLKEGQDYIDVMPAIHIGILDFTLFPEHPEFYAHYVLKNIVNNNIYSDKLRLNVLDLNQIHLATEENIACGLPYWARLFKAQTWEDLQMLASEYEVFEDITDTMQKALADKKIRMECEARERYERDRTSLYNSGRREGQAEARKESIGKTIKIMKDLNTSKETAIIQIMKHYALSEKEATDVVNSLWE